ncbi:glycine cleavage system aminomethyltransferase GcvT [Kiloniella laminariae]|uniref:aminomethyltransferase n=1 Tax=Kiloniella laminariae TaxID=454162 RepID=A0ABT4LL11_9PROT|nr:glycine cleavage system aminomethyltransferase GcvT [Kiloniella laminariae]MCZ4281798.1 glycine cleavage system aminomethyltransferase GcvT [Kiloniella laminariae]
MSEALKKTPLYDLHVELGAKMVPFAGYSMPVQYPAGIMAEHKHTRAAAAIFDVSHMGIVRLMGEKAIPALESLLPADLENLADNSIRYSFFTNETGGILDDLMITKIPGGLSLVINAACKDADVAHIKAKIGDQVEVEVEYDNALIALQGPKAAEVLARFAPACLDMKFITFQQLEIDGVSCQVSRSGYTGEDGYEIAIPAAKAEQLVRRLLEEAEVEVSGLGARDSLRMEAGLCLYGNDIDSTTTPIEAGLLWAIQKRRRNEGGFPGADVILKQIADGAPRRLVGILPEGRAPLRPGVEIANDKGEVVGTVTSGGFGPSVGGPIAIAYVAAENKEPGTILNALVRGKELPCKVVKMPFEQKSYYRG